jgi:4'-phosphopantetheinyl transferase
MSSLASKPSDWSAQVMNADDDFARTVGNAFARVGFAMPDADEARVLVFDSSAWMRHIDAAASVLDTGERRRAARFRFDPDCATYILAHALWRMALGVCLGVDAADVPLVSTPSGQPRLAGERLATSLSHSGSWVAIAACAAVIVGVDIERSPSQVVLNDLLATICTPVEAAKMQKLSAPERESALLALWTRKEALLKAFGIGLGEAPAKLPAAMPGFVTPPPEASGLPSCRVFDLDLPTGLVGALAAPAGVKRCRIHLLGGLMAYDG